MKKIAILPLVLTISCAFLSSDSPSQSSDTVGVVTTAKTMTDRQIESTYRQSSTDILTDAVHYNFRELRSLIDSMNAETILAIYRAESAAVQRDSAKMVLLSMIQENTRLRAQNTAYERSIEIMIRWPDYVYLFLLVILGSLFGQGLYKGYIDRKTAHEK